MNIDLHGLQGVPFTINHPTNGGNGPYNTAYVAAKFKRDFKSFGAEFVGSVLDEVPLVGEVKALYEGGVAELAVGLIPGGRKGKKIVEKGVDFVDGAKDATKRRVYIRKGTKEKIKENAPKTSDGKYIDPNTLKPIDGSYDIGHKKGEEWHRRKKMHQEKGSTRKEVIEAENNPDLYQIEDRSRNRSRKHEKK